MRAHTSTAAETPDTTPYFLRADEQWPYQAGVTAWSSSTSYVASRWMISQSYIPEAGEYEPWSDASNPYYAEYIPPDRLKMALTTNTSASNPGLTVIKNITVTGAGNNT